MLSIIKGYEGSRFGTAIENSNWVFPVAEGIHLLVLTVLLGTVLIVSLRLLGITFRDEPVAAFTRSFTTYFWLCVGVMLATGAMLFLCNAYKYYTSPSFHVKMVFLATALLFQATVFRRMTNPDSGDRNPLLYKLTGLLLFMLWFGVGLAGRAIGFLG